MNPNLPSDPSPLSLGIASLGIVGLGAFGWQHAITIAGLSEAKLVALVDPNEEILQRANQQWPETQGWSDLETAIEQSGADAWIVASSTASHIPVTRAILSAGKSVLLEKPIADSVTEAETLADLVHADSSNLMMGHILLFNSEFRQLRREVADRGPLRFIDGVRHRPATTMDRFPGENPFDLTMVHDLYCVLALMDRAEPSRVTSQVHLTDAGRPDLALAQLQWPDGTIASLTASFLTPSGMASDGFDRMEVFGEGWAARVRANPRPLEVWDDRAHWPMALEISAEGSVSGMLAEELRSFCRVVTKREPVPVGAAYQDAIQIARWIEQLETQCRTT